MSREQAIKEMGNLIADLTVSGMDEATKLARKRAIVTFSSKVYAWADANRAKLEEPGFEALKAAVEEHDQLFPELSSITTMVREVLAKAGPRPASR